MPASGPAEVHACAGMGIFAGGFNWSVSPWPVYFRLILTRCAGDASEYTGHLSGDLQTREHPEIKLFKLLRERTQPGLAFAIRFNDVQFFNEVADESQCL